MDKELAYRRFIERHVFLFHACSEQLCYESKKAGLRKQTVYWFVNMILTWFDDVDEVEFTFEELQTRGYLKRATIRKVEKILVDVGLFEIEKTGRSKVLYKWTPENYWHGYHNTERNPFLNK